MSAQPGRVSRSRRRTRRNGRSDGKGKKVENAFNADQPLGYASARRTALLTASALAASTLFWSTPVAAQTSPPSPAADAAQQPVDVSEIVVVGYRFLDADTSGITNLPLSIEKVPQSISLVNNDFAKAADLKNMGEIAQYTPGAIFASYSPS